MQNMETKVVFIQILLFTASAAVSHIKKERAVARITGGEEVPINYPYALSIIWLIDPQDLVCSATIIEKQWALTTTSCLSKRVLVVVRGNTTFYDCRSGCIDHHVTKYYRHLLYTNITYENDIGLLKVLEPFDGLQERSVTFPPKDYPYTTGTLAIGLGWGKVATHYPKLSVTLRYARLRIYRYNECRRIYESVVGSPDYGKFVVCAYAKGKNMCIGDGGGALLQMGNMQVGIASTGIECSKDHYPAIFTRITRHLKWINDTIRNSDAEDYFASIMRRKSIS